MPGRRITQRNLYAVLQCIDWANPSESPMLKAAPGSAAGTTASGLPPRYSPQCEKLAQWSSGGRNKPLEDGGAESVSFADLAGGELSTNRPRPATHIPYLPSTSGRGQGWGGNGKDTEMRGP